MTKKKEEAAPSTPAQAPEDGARDEKKTKQPSAKDAKITALERQIAEQETQASALKDSLLRTAAEYENYRRRSKLEQEASFGNGVSHAALQLLPVLDTLEAAAGAPTADGDYKKGVTLTLQKCEEVFQKLGITAIEALGQPFDPALHNACMQEAADGFESGAVTRVVQKGYLHNGKVIRHAMVAVSP